MSFSPSRPVEDADYLLSRAAAEAEAAERAAQAGSAEAHHRLASLYLDRLFGPAANDQVRELDKGRPVREPRRAAAIPFRMLKPVGDPADFTDLLVRLP